MVMDKNANTKSGDRICHINPTRGAWCDDCDRSRNMLCATTDWFCVNERAHAMLATVKTSIGNDHRWDRCKKYFNLYELVSSSCSALNLPSCAAYTPTSRSFFKLIELLQDHHKHLVTDHACKVAFLCDAPGGFVEAFLVYRRRRTAGAEHGGWVGKDVLHAISLIDDGSRDNVPVWRIPRELLRNNNVHLHGGDLYVLRNIDEFVDKVGARTCDLVTADGGFDFSRDFNSQERSSLRLLVSEVYTALRLVADRGALVMKIYDMRLPATIRLMWHLHCCFSGGIVIDKPCTSRAANSERFVICRWFERTARVDRLVAMLRTSVARGFGEVPCVGAGRTLPPSWFLRELALFNTRYITHQARVIMNTLTHMSQSADLPFHLFREQLLAARGWCRRYGIDINPSHHLSHSDPDPELNVANALNVGSVPMTVVLVGTSRTQMPESPRSLSPSTTPYRDGLLFPGRKLLAENCVELPGGEDSTDALVKVVA